MSVQAMTWARGTAPTAGSQLVLFGLADYADPHGVTYVSQATLASACSCGLRSVRDNLIRLEHDGLIARIRRHDHRGHRSSDYIVLAPNADDRGAMLDVEDDQIKTGRYPQDIAELARQLQPSSLPADIAGGGIRQAADFAGRPESLPADLSIPTGRSLHPYRQISPSLPAESAAEQLKNSLLTEPERTAGQLPRPAADEVDQADEEAGDYAAQSWPQIKKRLSNGAHP